METFSAWRDRIIIESLSTAPGKLEEFLILQIGERQILYGDIAFVDEAAPTLVGIMPTHVWIDEIEHDAPPTPPVAESWRAIGNRKMRVK